MSGSAFRPRSSTARSRQYPTCSCGRVSVPAPLAPGRSVVLHSAEGDELFSHRFFREPARGGPARSIRAHPWPGASASSTANAPSSTPGSRATGLYMPRAGALAGFGSAKAASLAGPWMAFATAVGCAMATTSRAVLRNSTQRTIDTADAQKLRVLHYSQFHSRAR